MNGIDILGMVFVIALAFATVEYMEWRVRDADRRIQRLRQRGQA